MSVRYIDIYRQVKRKSWNNEAKWCLRKIDGVLNFNE